MASQCQLKAHWHAALQDLRERVDYVHFPVLHDAIIRLPLATPETKEGLVLVWILRAFVSVILGVSVFLVLVVLLALTAVSGIANSDTYTKPLADADAYRRLYSEVLTPSTIDRYRVDLLGDRAIISSEELVQLLAEVAPPEYLKEQVEMNLDLVESFASGDSESLELYLQIEGPLQRVGPAVASVVERRIDENLSVSQSSSSLDDSEETSSDRHVDEITSALETLLSGDNTSASLSEITGLTEGEILDVFDRSIDSILSNRDVDPRHRQSLRESRPALRQTFAEGNFREFLLHATRLAAEAATDLALAKVRAHLDDQGRLDLVPLLAGEALGTSEAQLQETARKLRQSIRSALVWARNVALGVALLALAVAVSMYWKSPAGLVKWLYWTLILAGAGALGLLLLAYLVLPNALEVLVYESLRQEGNPISAFGPLASEVAASVVKSRISGLVWVPALPLVAGLALWIVGTGWTRRKAATRDYGPATAHLRETGSGTES